MEIDWRNVINGMVGPFPEGGEEMPELEIIKKNKVGLEDKGEFSKLSMVIWFFTDSETGKTYTMQKHWLIDHGEVSLREALLAIKKQT